MMAEHGVDCHGIGKFDCEFDERVYVLSLDDQAEGNAEAPSGWWAPIDLDVDCDGHPDDDSTVNEAAGAEHTCDGSCMPEWDLFQHYGTRWLVVGGDSQGFVRVVALPTEEQRDLLAYGLLIQFNAWYDGDEDQL